MSWQSYVANSSLIARLASNAWITYLVSSAWLALHELLYVHCQLCINCITYLASCPVSMPCLQIYIAFSFMPYMSCMACMPCMPSVPLICHISVNQIFSFSLGIHSDSYKGISVNTLSIFFLDLKASVFYLGCGLLIILWACIYCRQVYFTLICIYRICRQEYPLHCIY